MRLVIGKAAEREAKAVQEIIAAIPWISEATKSADGFNKTKECCIRGEVFVVKVDCRITSMMILKRGSFAEPECLNGYVIPLIATLESERRKGHARRLVKKAKQIAGKDPIQAYLENNTSLSLLASEDFIPVEGKVDWSGHQLYEWLAKVRVA
jgi:hypothetical protein